MLDSNLERLAQDLGRSLCGCDGGRCDLLHNDLGLCRALIQLLSQGEPVSMEALARASGRSPQEVSAAIRASGDVEVDAQGRIVGAGLSLRPTAHRIVLNERMLYAWCALDALMYPPLLNLEAQIESPCAVTGDPVRVRVSAAGVRDVAPPSAVVSMVQPDEDAGVRPGFCNHVHFFRSGRAARPWVEKRRDVQLLSVADAFLLGKRLVSAQDGATGSM